MTGRDLAEVLEGLGYDFFTGVPCSLVEGLLRALETHPRLPYVPAPREDVALGLAAGAWLGGRRPAVIMQNSGLGTGMNALASLSLLYRLPALLLVTWRGYGGRDAPEHLLTGAVTPRLLDLLGMAHRELTREAAASTLEWAAAESTRRMEPVAVLVPPGVLEETPGRPPAADGRAPSAPAADVARGSAPPAVLSRLEALRAAVGAIGREPAIHANGYIGRESHAVADRPENFYMIGSMGLASAIGLGLALARPDRRVVVFDGDGNLLMGLGTLALVAAVAPANLAHVVFDNAVYGSTGGQRSISADVRLDRLAAAAGYASARAVTAAGEVRDAVEAALAGAGPHFVLVRVTAAQADVPRIPYPPVAIRDRFRAAVGGR
ncbi:MAG TPA: thiamine pyrophosphate-dependent enzyme [Thermodesulfobacteriota bacterium]